MPTASPARTVRPARRTLSPRAAAFLRAVQQQENARRSAVEKSVSAALSTVTKAEKTEMTAVYDANGRIVGVVPASKITPVANVQAAPAKPAPAKGAPVQAAHDDAVTKVAALRKTALRGDTPAERNTAYNTLRDAAYTAITRAHAGPR